MNADGFALFETAVGTCGVAWGANGIVGASLPRADEVSLRAQLSSRYAGAAESDPPPEIASVIDSIRALLRGERYDLSEAALDMADVPAFNRRVYEITRSIPPGKTLTYGDIASRLGDVSLSRAVGQALGENPFPPIVPCHRVISADGRMHGFSAAGGVTMKLRMLNAEGWRANQLTLFENESG